MELKEKEFLAEREEIENVETVGNTAQISKDAPPIVGKTDIEEYIQLVTSYCVAPKKVSGNYIVTKQLTVEVLHMPANTGVKFATVRLYIGDWNYIAAFEAADLAYMIDMYLKREENNKYTYPKWQDL
jgi:hypothetical protein